MYGLLGTSLPENLTVTLYIPSYFGVYATEYVKFLSLLNLISTGSNCPFGFSTVTSTCPFPAEKVSTVKLAGAPTTGPCGSIPGP